MQKNITSISNNLMKTIHSTEISYSNRFFGNIFSNSASWVMIVGAEFSNIFIFNSPFDTHQPWMDLFNHNVLRLNHNFL